MVTTSKGQNQSQKVKAPGNLLWLNLRKELLPVRAVQLWNRFWKACAPPLQARPSGGRGSVGSGAAGRRSGVSPLQRSPCALVKRQSASWLLRETSGPPPPSKTFSGTVLPYLCPRDSGLLLRSSWGMAQNSGSVQIKVFLVSSPGFEGRLYPFRGVSLGKSVSTAGLSSLLREMGRHSVISLPPPAQCLMWSRASTHPVCPTPRPLCFGVSSLSDPGEGAHW